MKFPILLVLTTSMAAAQGDVIASYISQDEEALGLRLAAADWAGHTSVPSTFAPSANLVRMGGAGTLLFGGWGSAIDVSKRVGFKVTVEPGFCLSLEKLTGINTAGGRISGTEMTSFVWGYRVDDDKDGVFERDWVFGNTYTATADGESFQSIQAFKNWNLGLRLLTKGTVEFAVFGTATNVNAMLEAFSGDIVLHGNVYPLGALDAYQHVASYSIPINEASAVTYNQETDTLFVIGDEGFELAELTKTGVKLGAMPFEQSGSRSERAFDDPEGISYLGGGKFAISDERRNLGGVVTYDPATRPTLAQLTPTSYPYVGSYGNNTGLEGIAYDPVNRSLWSVKELGPVKFYEMENFPEVIAGGPVVVKAPISRRNITGIGNNQFSDIYVMAESGYFSATDPRRLNILLLGREANMIYEITRDGLVVDVLDLRFLNRHTIEGITMDDAGNIYLVSEGAVSSLASDLHVLVPGMPPAPYTAEKFQTFTLYSDAFRQFGLVPSQAMESPALVSAIAATRDLGRGDVTGDPESYGLFTEDSIQDLRGPDILIQADEDQVHLRVPIERSTDAGLNGWTGTGVEMEATLPKIGNKAFYRLTLPE